MQISFLDLVPKRPTATVTIEGEAGPATFEIAGIALSQLAEIGRKFPAFARMIEGNATLLSVGDAMPTLIAAGLGHYGDADYERHAAQLPPDVMLSIATEIVRLTFPRPTNPAAEGEAEGGSANGSAPAPASLAGLNS